MSIYKNHQFYLSTLKYVLFSVPKFITTMISIAALLPQNALFQDGKIQLLKVNVTFLKITFLPIYVKVFLKQIF